MKKFEILSVLVFLSVVATAQNLQLHYDFGHTLYEDLDSDHTDRPSYTSTFEYFGTDDFGSTFFFVDADYSNGVEGAYGEFSRELCFWRNSAFNWLSAHVEYNGGLAVGTKFNNAYLAGATYSGHSDDWSKVWSVSLMYKNIPHTRNLDGDLQTHNYQVTGVWNVDFASQWFTFSGFIDFWRECRLWQNTTHILLSEMQIWLNINKMPNLDRLNLSLGSELKLSNNFVDKGFYAIPTLAVKWTFD